MKTTLLRFNLPVLLLLFGLLAISCSKDKEEVKPDTTNQFVYDGRTFTFQSGLVEDYGKLSFYSNTETHHNYDYTITDGTFTKQSDDTYGPSDASVVLFAELLSPGITGFKVGTFTFINSSDDEDLTASELETKYKDKAYFNVAFIVIDNNNNKTFEQGDIALAVAGGTIKVSGSPEVPTLEFDVTLTDGKTLKGTYTGGFTFSDETD